MKAVAIIPAAGLGLRLKSGIPKPYLMLAGMPVLAHTLKAFEDCPDIAKIYVVVAEDKIAYCKQNIVDKYRLKRVTGIIAGGEKRQDSVYNGLCELDNDTGIVVVHDGARPLIDPRLISRCIKNAKMYGAAIAALPLNDTIKQVSLNGQIKKTLPRDELWAAQTPQAFKYPLLIEAFRKANKNNLVATDEAGLVERMGHRIQVVRGCADNIKVTTPEDLIIAEAILHCRA